MANNEDELQILIQQEEADLIDQEQVQCLKNDFNTEMCQTLNKKNWARSS